MGVLTNKKYKHIEKDFYTNAQGRELGFWRSKILFSEHGHVAYQVKGDDE